MSPRVRFPRDLQPKPVAERAVTRYYRLLDTGVMRNQEQSFCGQAAAEAVAEEFNVPTATVWQWIREHAGRAQLKSA